MAFIIKYLGQLIVFDCTLPHLDLKEIFIYFFIISTEMPKCKEKLCDFPSKVECKWKDFEKNFNNGNLSDFFGQPNWPPLSELNWNSRNPFKSYVGLKLICFLKIAEIRPNQNVDIEVLLILILWKNTTFTEYSVTSCHWPIITDLMILRDE